MRKLSLLVVMVMVLGMLAACGPEAATPVPPTATTAVEQATATAPAVEEPTETTDEATATPSTSSAGGTLADIKQRGKLIVGVKYDVPTFGFLNPQTNKVEGFDVDMAKAVARRIFGNEEAVEFTEAISANRIPYLNEGKVDIIFSTMTANEERAQQIDFSDCYYVAGQSLLVPVNSTITDVNGLAGKTVGTVSGSTSERNIRQFAPEAKVELFATYAEAVQAMESGRVEVVTTDDIILYGFAKRNPEKFKVVGGQFTTEPYAAGVKKGNSDLLAEVNGAIRDLKQNGGWATSYRTWLSENVPALPPQDWRDVAKPATTPAASPAATTGPVITATVTTTTTGVMTSTAGGTLADIKQRGKLIVGVKYDVPTFGFLNPQTNKVEGFDVDMAKAVARRIFGNEEAIEFTEAISANRIPYLNEGKVDVIFSTMTANEERAQQIDFSDCYYVAGQSLLVPVNSTIADVNGLAGKTVGTVTGSTSERNIRQFAPEARVELFATYAEAVQAMESGRVEVVTTDDIILYGFAKRNPEKFKVVGGQFTKEPYAAGVRKGNSDLLAEVNGAIRDLKENAGWGDIYTKWLSEDVPQFPPQDWRDVTKQP
ncbi:MAG TPA: glutamate ABC transporter substrate-binding protein [Chloroflexia bacterium]|nr:glutamate ABC transporter substrate-binding protein [Chloroflexia bacterium]